MLVTMMNPMSKLSLFHKTFLLGLLLAGTGILKAWAANEPYQHTLQGKIKKGDTLVVKDEKFQNSAYDWALIQNTVVDNVITLGLFRNGDPMPTKAFKCKLDLKVEYWSQPGQADPIVEDHVVLEIAYDTARGAIYQAERSYQFKNGHKVKITVNEISSAELGEEIPAVLRLTGLINIDRQYLPDPNGSLKPTLYVVPRAAPAEEGGVALRQITTTTEAGGEVLTVWSNVDPSEMYDFDWTFIDGESEFGAILDNTGESTPPEELEVMFRNNFTRVTLSGHNYPITLVHQAKYLIMRVRGVNMVNGLRDELEWGYKVHALTDTWHQPEKNWQYNASFAEEGKKKEVVTYADGTLRNRQSVTVGNHGTDPAADADKFAVVQETLYDEFGRGVLSTLPAPLKSKIMTYYPGLHLNASGQPYSFQNMYGIDTGCIDKPDMMYAPAAAPGTGAAGYYSSNNPFRDDANTNNRFIPDAGGYPFSLTRFTADNTGRVRQQGGVGSLFQPGEKATRFFYGKPEQWELDRLFGNDVGFAHHYMKKMTIDPNGQASISYENASGKTIATALVGGAPANLDALPSHAPAASKTSILLTPSQFRFDPARLTLNASTSYMSAIPGQTLEITYNIDQLKHFYKAQQDICSNCYYTLKVTVSDDCGEKVEKVNSFIGSAVGNCNLVDPQVSSFEHVAAKPGTYYITFELGLSEDVIGAYTDEYIRKNTDLRTNFDFVKDRLDSLNFKDCISDCKSCMVTLGAKPYFMSRVVDQLRLQGVNVEVSAAAIDSWSSGMYDLLLAHCQAIQQQCVSSPCAEFEKEMLDDVSPGGQYALFNENGEPLETAINVLHNNWRTVFPVLLPTNSRYIEEQFVNDSGRVISPYDSTFTLQLLIKYWQPSWADRFLDFHPEYCALMACHANETYIRWDQRLEEEILTVSQLGELEAGLQYQAAQADWLVNADPYFKPDGAGASQAADFRQRLLTYSQHYVNAPSVKGLTQMVDYLLYCANPDGSTNTSTEEDNWSNCAPVSDCRVPDREWALYKIKYVELKKEFYQLVTADYCVNACKPGKTLPVSGGCPEPAMFRLETSTDQPGGGYTAYNIKYDGGIAPYSTIELVIGYEEGYGDTQEHTVAFTPGSTNIVYESSSIPLEKIRILRTTCLPLPAIPPACDGVGGTLQLSMQGKRVSDSSYTDVNNGVPVTYFIKKGYSDEQPDLSGYCAGATASFYNCLEVTLPASSGQFKYHNVWQITCQAPAPACTNPTQFQMLTNLGNGKYQGETHYYYFNVIPLDCPDTSFLGEYPCVDVYVSGSQTPIRYYSNGSEQVKVYMCEICPSGSSGNLYADNLVSDNGTEAVYMQGYTKYVIISNTSPSDNLPSPTICAGPTKTWYSCFTATAGGVTNTYINATVFVCQSGRVNCGLPTKVFAGNFLTEIPNGAKPSIIQLEDDDKISLFYLEEGNRVCDPDYLDGSYGTYDCVVFSGSNESRYYQNMTVKQCYTIPSSGMRAAQTNGRVAGETVITNYTDGQQYLVKLTVNNVLPAAKAGYTAWQFRKMYGIRTSKDSFRNFTNVWVARKLQPPAAKSKTATTAQPMSFEIVTNAEEPIDCMFSDADFVVTLRALPTLPPPTDAYPFEIRFRGGTPIPDSITLMVEVDASSQYPDPDVSTFYFNSDNADLVQFGYFVSSDSEPVITITVNCRPREDPGGCSPLYQNKTPRFQLLSNPSQPVVDLDQLAAQASAAIQQQVESNCRYNAESWAQQMEDCLFGLPDSASKRAALINGFYEVCKLGGDADHINGSSTAPPGKTTPSGYTSFGDVIQQVMGVSTYSMVCNPWVIDGPFPYKNKPQAVQPVLSNTSSAICEKFAVLQSDHTANGGGDSFYQYVKNRFGTAVTITEAELNMLQKSCANCRYLLEKDIKLPVFLDPESKGCIQPTDYHAAKAAFNTALGGTPQTDHANYGRMLATYLNHAWGFTMGYEEYAAYEEKLAAEPTAILCNQPVFGTVPVDPLSCIMGLVNDAVMQGNYKYARYIEEEKRKFRAEYISICSKTRAKASVTAPQQIYHYTLYYYDLAGQLIRTVPPEGVVPLSDQEVLTVQEFRETPKVAECVYSGPVTEGSKETVNQNLRQLVEEGGALEYWLQRPGEGPVQVMHTGYGPANEEDPTWQDVRYLINTCINGSYLTIDIYEMVQAPGAAYLGILRSKRTAVSLAGRLPLKEWTNLVIQPSQGQTFMDNLNVYVDGYKCPPAPPVGATCGLQIGVGGNMVTYPESFTAVRHIRYYSQPLAEANIINLASNICMSADGGFMQPGESRWLWQRFNVGSGEPGGGGGLPSDGVEPVYPSHKMATSYAYNTLGQVVKQETPDAGISRFWYDHLGRLILSQNAEQLLPTRPVTSQNPANRYSYTKYEPLGRISEVGEVLNAGVVPDTPFLSETEYAGVIENKLYRQRTKTYYDVQPAWVTSPITLENLRKRVAASTYEETTGTVDHEILYSYDQLGNVKTLWQQLAGLGNRKKIDYNYDLASGKVRNVRYQHGQKDQFIYGYEYDAENRLIRVENGTALSGDWTILDKKQQARYQYYPHGPLSRIELGEHNIQGIDYAYTLQGWLKGMNSNFLDEGQDMGADGAPGLRSTFSKDVFGFSLNYYDNDYSPVGGSSNPFALQFNRGSSVEGKQLYNGNISSTTVALSKFRQGAPVGYTYAYDQLNRLVRMRQQEISQGSSWNPRTGSQPYAEDITYDGNGNIQSYQRNGVGSGNLPLAMDQLQYSYIANTNRLSGVTDGVAGAYSSDLQGQHGYEYDKIGNLITESATMPVAGSKQIYWNVYGKISEVDLGAGSTLKYGYDASGNRISKTYTRPGQTPETTYYLRDATGNSLATYVQTGSAYTWAEQHLYGSSRLGYWQPDMDVNSTEGGLRWLAANNKRYELTNHLGNVLGVLLDEKDGNGQAAVFSMQDYYPFGSAMPGRYGKVDAGGNIGEDVEGSGYRYGFNGKENDNEVKGEGNQVAFEARVYDPRVGRFLSRDPLANKYPYQSDYSYAGNSPIRLIDVLGMGPGDPPTFVDYAKATFSTFMIMQSKMANDAAEKIMPSVLGSLNGTGKWLTFGLYSRSPEDIGLNEQYWNGYNAATVIFQSSPMPGKLGGTGPGTSQSLALAGETSVLYKTFVQKIRITSTVFSYGRGDSQPSDGGGSGDGSGSQNSSGSLGNTVKAKDLKLLHSEKVILGDPSYDRIKKLSDKQLIESVTNPAKYDPVTVNTKTGRVVDGNTRVYELQRRKLDVDVPIRKHVPDDSDFIY